ncbi:site-specific integrase [Flavobacteriaceae sp. LMIT009]
MATVKIKLDTRRAKTDGTYNIIFKIRHQRITYTINSGLAVFKQYWDYEETEINSDHPNARLLNLKLLKEYYNIEKAILMLDDNFTIEKLRSIIKGGSLKQSKSFKEFTQQLINEMLATNNIGNAIVYRTAMNRFLAFCKHDIQFTEMDYELLTKYEHHLKLKGLKQNSISNYFRTIRAIYNKAIKHKLVDRAYYPFYDISIKSQRTVNRAISKGDIKKLISLPLERNSAQYKALNYFLLSFYLRGINFTDIAYLKRSNIVNNRIHYTRRKTHKLYSVRLFTPAKKIIDDMHGDDNDYLLPILTNDVVEDSLQAKCIIKQWVKTTNKYLKRLGEQIELDLPLTGYVSRYSFANIAKKQGYSNELIAEALGHAYGNKTTAIYLDAFDENKLDVMHYEVISLNRS